LSEIIGSVDERIRWVAAKHSSVCRDDPWTMTYLQPFYPQQTVGKYSSLWRFRNCKIVSAVVQQSSDSVLSCHTH